MRNNMHLNYAKTLFLASGDAFRVYKDGVLEHNVIRTPTRMRFLNPTTPNNPTRIPRAMPI